MTARPILLLVDDEAANRELLESILVPEGYEVVHATDGIAAIDAVARGRIDLVLLDVLMPGIDGIETCHRIRRQLGRTFLPIIFVTALGDRGARIRCKDAGADDFLTKPVDELELMVRVRNLLRVKEAHDLREQQRAIIERELERARDQLLHAERLATLGTLAAGVGHELNNISMVLSALLPVLHERVADSSPIQPDELHDLSRAAEHVRQHARQLLSLGRPGPEHAERLDLREVVESTVSMLHAAGRTKRIDVRLELGATPLPATINRTRIEQVLVNLIGNAADALEDSPADRRHIVVRLSSHPQTSQVSCQIEDTGCGIPESLIETVFEPYYTTKPAGCGTGLGLPVVKQIIESYGGTLRVTSQPGIGSTFAFELPAELALPAQAAA